MKNKAVFEPKSLFLTCQETLIKNLDALFEIGCVPYEFIELSLRHATPEQLQRIEKCNPKIKRDSNGLWLAHCLLFPDIKDEYNKMGLHREPKKWRSLYRRRYEENELKKESVKQKIREKYNTINNEKAAKSIKVIKGALPKRRRTFEDSSKLQ
ncbi:hypothetical protein K501DRAFT_266374 [Backusella circina FSU 941]|nr:hypothetical protein K501DRAFT_266374 [Backusella circina FSU 941]